MTHEGAYKRGGRRLLEEVVEERFMDDCLPYTVHGSDGHIYFTSAAGVAMPPSVA
jgi:hypothetical protein